MLVPILYAIWGCVPELANECQDMTNSSSTYLSIIVGAIIAGVISWWIYYRQQKTSERQQFTLSRIKELDERHDKILKSVEQLEKNHQHTLKAIMELEKRIERTLERGEVHGKPSHEQ